MRDDRGTAAVLSAVLRERVDGVAAPAPGLAAAARRQARSRRRHQGVGAVGLLTAVLLLAGYVAAAPDTSQQTAPPAEQTGPTLRVPAGSTVEIDFKTLPTGVDPAVAWWSHRVLHRTDGRDLQVADSALGAVELPDGGALVTSGTTARPSLSIVDIDGHAQPPFAATAPVIDPGGQVAYVDLEKHLVVRHEPDGTGSSVAVPFPDGGVRLVGFLGDDIVADPLFGPARIIRRDGSSERLRGLAVATATDARSGTVALRSRDGRCLEVRRGEGRLWLSCANAGRFTSIVAISPDGHRVLLRRDKSGHPGTSEYAVAVAETGRVLRLFSAAGDTLGLGQATFEHHNLLVSAYHDADSRIVRCDLDAVCQVSTGSVGASPTTFTPVWFP
jgi:hypothetical protein